MSTEKGYKIFVSVGLFSNRFQPSECLFVVFRLAKIWINDGFFQLSQEANLPMLLPTKREAALEGAGRAILREKQLDITQKRLL